MHGCRGPSVSAGCEHSTSGRWTVGADGVRSVPWSDEWVDMPAGRLHAVSGTGLLTGRALCLTPILLLDPRGHERLIQP